MAVVTFSPSSNPSYAGFLRRSMIQVHWEVFPAQTVEIWINFGTATGRQVGGSTGAGAQNTWVRDVFDGDVFSLVDHASRAVLATFTETVTQINGSIGGSFSTASYAGWQASHTYFAGQIILDSNGNLQQNQTPGPIGSSAVSGSATPAWSTTDTVNTSDGGVTWHFGGPPSPQKFLAGTLTWTADATVPTDYLGSLPQSVGLWTSSEYGPALGLDYPGIYGPPPMSPFTGGSGIVTFPFSPPSVLALSVYYMGPVERNGSVVLDQLNTYGPGAVAAWVRPGARFYITWASQDAATATALFSDAGPYFTIAYGDAPNAYVDSFVADPPTIQTFGTPTGSTTLKWKTPGFGKVVVVYGWPQSLYAAGIPSNVSGRGNLVAAIDYSTLTAQPADSWQIDLSGWVPNGAVFLLYDATTWNIVDLTANSLVALSDYLRATTTVAVVSNASRLSAAPNPVDAVSGAGSSTISWFAPDSTSVVLRQTNPTTGPIIATGSATGSVAVSSVTNGSLYYLLDATTGNILRTISVAVRPTPADFRAFPNPITTAGVTYSTTLTWTGGTASTILRADDPLGGTQITTGGAAGSVVVDQTIILNGRVFYLTDGTGTVLSQAVVTLLYIGSNPALFGIPIPDPVTQLAALGTSAPVFPVDPDYAFQKGRSWKTNVLQFAPNLVKQSYILAETPEISFEIGLTVQPGSLLPGSPTTTKFRKLYAFYIQQKGKASGFYFYDPRPWGMADYTPVNYRENPATRLTSPGSGVNPSSSTGLYIMWFAEDSLNFERFALLLVKSQLKLVGQAASYGSSGGGGGLVTTYSISGTIAGISSPASLAVSGIGTFLTNTDGTYLIPGVAPGSYTVTPALSGMTFTPATSSVLVRGGNVAGVDFTVATGGGGTVSTYQLGGTIAGLAGAAASVFVSGAGGSVVSTDSSGNYAATGLNAGSHTVTPSLSGYAFTPASQGVTISASNVTGVDFSATATSGGGGVSPPAWIPSGYSLVYAEEFNGTSLPSLWQRGYYFSNTVPSSQVTVSGGALHLTWQRGGVPDISVSSSQTFHYGYFEVRMKWTVANGAWPAFWFIPAQSAGSHTGEIDVFEGQGNDNQAFFATLHEWNGSSQIWQSTPNRFPVSTDFSAYHTYGLLWEPGGNFTWYLDGVVIHTYTGAPSIFDTQSVFPILSMQEGNDWSVGNLSGVSATSLTNDIDYFRVFQHP